MCDIICYNRRWCTAATLPHTPPIQRLRTKKPKWMGNVTGNWEVMRFFLLENHGIFRMHHVQTRRLDIFSICLSVTICLGNLTRKAHCSDLLRFAQLLATMWNSWHASSRSKMSWNLLLTSMFHARYAARTLRDLNSLAISGWSIPGESVPQEIPSDNPTWLANEPHPFRVNFPTQKTSQKKIGHIASHVWWHLKLYSIVVSKKKYIFNIYSWCINYDIQNHIEIWHGYDGYGSVFFDASHSLSGFIPNPPLGIGSNPYPLRTSRFEVMICIQWVYSAFFTIIIHYCSPLLFTTIVHHHYSPLYIHH